MKRFSVALLAMIAAFAIGFATVSTTAGAAAADQTAQAAKKKKKKKKKIPLTITFAFQSTSGPYSEGSSSYSGQLIARKSVCFANRTVTILRDGVPMLWAVTGSGGAYRITVNSPAPPGQYTASVARQVFKKGKKKKKKKIVCLAAVTTPPISNP
jgi:hypothetical protein